MEEAGTRGGQFITRVFHINPEDFAAFSVQGSALRELRRKKEDKRSNDEF